MDLFHLFPDYTLVGGNSNIVWCSSLFGEWSHLTNIFQMGWNQQLDTNKIVPCFFWSRYLYCTHPKRSRLCAVSIKYQDLVGRHGSLIRGSPNKINDTSPFFFGARDESYVLFLGGIPHPLTVKYSSVHFLKGPLWTFTDSTVSGPGITPIYSQIRFSVEEWFLLVKPQSREIQLRFSGYLLFCSPERCGKKTGLTFYWVLWLFNKDPGSLFHGLYSPYSYVVLHPLYTLNNYRALFCCLTLKRCDVHWLSKKRQYALPLLGMDEQMCGSLENTPQHLFLEFTRENPRACRCVRVSNFPRCWILTGRISWECVFFFRCAHSNQQEEIRYFFGIAKKKTNVKDILNY